MGTKQETALAQIMLHQHLQKQWKGQQGRLRHEQQKDKIQMLDNTSERLNTFQLIQ